VTTPSPTVSRPGKCITRRADWAGLRQPLTSEDNDSPTEDYGGVFPEHHTPSRRAVYPCLILFLVAHPPCAGRRNVAMHSLSATSFNTVPNPPHAGQSKRCRAKAQRVIREAEQTSWKTLISSLSRSTRPDVVREKLRHMSGQYGRSTLPGLSAGGAVLTSQTQPTLQRPLSRRCAARITKILTSELLKTAHRLSPSILLLVSLKLVTPPSPWTLPQQVPWPRWYH
jgi:hypothetical protein